jgi:hypothetical protein
VHLGAGKRGELDNELFPRSEVEDDVLHWWVLLVSCTPFWYAELGS